MNIKNTTIGIAIGLIVLSVVKDDEQQTDTTASIAAVPAVVHRQSSPRSVTTVSSSAKPSSSNADDRPSHWSPEHFFPQRPRLLKQLLRESIAPAEFVIPTADELDRFEQLLLLTLRQQFSWQELADRWSQIGWELRGWASGGARYVAICEPADQRCGRGIYVVRLGSQSRIAVQAPHRFHDAQTGWLTGQLFEENEILVAGWNTVHRDKVDLAHQREHFFNAMTRAVLRMDEGIVVAQLHGFDDQKRESPAGSASLIVSDTTRYPGRLVQSVAAGQKFVFGEDAVKLYPVEVTELGGTRNQQARVFHSFGRPGFLHLELSRQLRAKLTSDASIRGQFFSALTSAAADWQQSLIR